MGSSDAEWSAVLAAVQQLAEPQHNIKPVASGSSGGGSACSADAVASHSKMVQGPPAGNGSSSSKGSSCGASNGSGGGSSGCQVAADLLAELSHLPCFLLMEFMEGSKLSDCPHALDPVGLPDIGAAAPAPVFRHNTAHTAGLRDPVQPQQLHAGTMSVASLRC